MNTENITYVVITRNRTQDTDDYAQFQRNELFAKQHVDMMMDAATLADDVVSMEVYAIPTRELTWDIAEDLHEGSNNWHMMDLYGHHFSNAAIEASKGHRAITSYGIYLTVYSDNYMHYSFSFSASKTFANNTSGKVYGLDEKLSAEQELSFEELNLTPLYVGSVQ